ncbi:MAG TPA: HDOD domain-containing protein [Terriglobales bacterium]|jgi:HD-like signal output (HDOD) protein|nr:HDOD domain-containing protein [Terriglobales bacterium]
MPAISLDALQQRMQRLDAIPSVSAILFPLLRCLDLPIDQVEVAKIVDLISHDKSLTAQCLHMANSPLFGRWNKVDSARGAVLALGIGRVRDIATSCCMLKLLPKDKCPIDPRTFWEHSLGVALVSRRLARRIGFRDPEKAYLAGLLHDLGIITNLLLLPEEFREVSTRALATRSAFDEVEAGCMGFTHCVTGSLLGQRWRLGGDILEVIRYHHQVEHASLYRGLTAIVHIGDLVCRSCGLGFGYDEEKPVDLIETPAWAMVAEECASVRGDGAARFASEMCLYVAEVKRLVGVLFRLGQD